MPSFESGPFSKTIQASSQPPMRNFVIGAPEDDASQPIPQQQPSVQEMQQIAQETRQARKESESKITPTGKKRIELLAGIGRLTKDVKLGEHTFTLRTLKSKEVAEATQATFSQVNTQLEAFYASRREQLARSIYLIDGQDIALVIGDGSIESILSMIDSFEDVVVDKLYDEFSALKKESKTLYGLNTSKDAQEVSADLKK